MKMVSGFQRLANGASEIINVAVGKYRGSLLTGEQAVVGFHL